jgi:hypothetical protein
MVFKVSGKPINTSHADFNGPLREPDFILKQPTDY